MNECVNEWMKKGGKKKGMKMIELMKDGKKDME